jgi:hypothetical protein
MINSENVFTYPSSMCFSGNDSLFIPADVQKFVEYKKSTIKSRKDKVIQEVVNEEEALKWARKILLLLLLCILHYRKPVIVIVYSFFVTQTLSVCDSV